MQFSNVSDFAKYLKAVITTLNTDVGTILALTVTTIGATTATIGTTITSLIQSSAGIVLDALGYIDLNTGAVIQARVLDIQVDNTLDPGASPTLNDRYIITDAGDINANFGSIAGLEDNDIVRYDGDDFVVSLDVSAVIDANSRAVTFVIGRNEGFIFNTAGGWTQRIIIFYSDWDDGVVSDTFYTIQKGDSLWSDGVTAANASPSGNIGTNTRSVIPLNEVIVPGTTRTLDTFKVVNVKGQVFLSSVWSYSGFVFSGSGFGTQASLVDNDDPIAVQTGGSSVASRSFVGGGGHGHTSGTDSIPNLPARVRIVCEDI